jgi:uncharacterized Zn-binding protein involved in type VI secretion
MVTGIVPHVGGPIVAPGEPTVLIGFLPAARVTDQAVCVGPPDMIAMGSPTVLIGGLMAARMGDPTEHGGVIVLGDFTVMIGEVGMGGAASGMGMGMAAAVTSAVAGCSENPSKYSKPASPSALPAPPHSSAPPKNAPAAALEASQQAGAVEASLDKPPAGLPQIKKEKEIVCGIKENSVTVTCQHGREAADGLLEVVGAASGDTIQCTSKIIGTCGSHPDWEIDGPQPTHKIGTAESFNARSVSSLPPTALILPVWTGDIAPQIYNVSVTACGGPSYAFEIHSYPLDAQSASIDLKAYQSSMEQLEDAIKSMLGLLVDENKLDIEFLKGKGNYSLQWQEDDESNLAYYEWKLGLGFSPLIGLSGRLPIGPSALPAALGVLGNAGFFLELSGDLNVQAEGGQLGPASKDAGHFDVSADCSVEIAVGGSAYLGAESNPIISVEVAILSGLEAELTGVLEEHKPKIEAEISFEGLKGKVTFHCLFYDKESDCTFLDGSTLWQKDFYPFGEPEDDGGGGDSK